MTKAKLNEVLRKHKLWLNGEDGGVRADLRYANLSGADLRDADLRDADLRNAGLRYSDLLGADLSRADLSRADLSGADLSVADLSGVDLRGTNLYGAKLIGAKCLDTVIVDETTQWFKMQCPEEGSYIGYKKCRNNLIVELEIPADAKRSSATTEKCRASKAKVLSITHLDGAPAQTDSAVSKYDEDFVYRIGETVEVSSFDENRWNGCAPGIHHFIKRKDAVNYFF